MPRHRTPPENQAIRQKSYIYNSLPNAVIEAPASGLCVAATEVEETRPSCSATALTVFSCQSTIQAHWPKLPIQPWAIPIAGSG